MKVLLSIKPEYADRIFSGEKKYEFRRAIFKDRKVTHVVVYASSPLRKVVGEFEVLNILHDDVRTLWNKTGSKAGISESKYFDYFSNRDEGYAIQIGMTKKYEPSHSLEQEYGVVPPQSFAYLQPNSTSAATPQ
jgi:predicted transcriptional regulator